MLAGAVAVVAVALTIAATPERHSYVQTDQQGPTGLRRPDEGWAPVYSHTFDNKLADYVSENNCTTALDNTNYRKSLLPDAAQSIKQTLGGGGTSGRFDVAFTPAEIADAEWIRMGIYIHVNDDAATLSAATLLIQAPDTSNYWLLGGYAYGSNPGPGWRTSWIHLDNSTTAGSPDSTNVAKLRMTAACGATDTSVVSWDEVSFYRGIRTPMCAIVLDDGTAGQYDAMAYAASKGVYCTLFVHGYLAEFESGTSYMSVAQLLRVQNMGHLIANHGWNQTVNGENGWDAWSAGTKKYAISRNIEWMRENGFHKGANIFATPGGQWCAEDDWPLVKGLVHFARSTSQRDRSAVGLWHPAAFPEFWCSVNSANASEETEISILNAVNRDAVTVPIFHTIRTGQEYAEWRAAVNYAAAYRDAGLIETVTCDRLLDPIEQKYDPSDGKRTVKVLMPVYGEWKIDGDGARTNGGGIVGGSGVALLPQGDFYIKAYDHGTTSYEDLHTSDGLAGFTNNYQMTPDAASEAANDAIYFGKLTPFHEIPLDMATKMVAKLGTVAYDDAGHGDGDYQLEKASSFGGVTAGDPIYVDDAGSGDITSSWYIVKEVIDASSVVLAESAGDDATDAEVYVPCGVWEYYDGGTWVAIPNVCDRSSGTTATSTEEAALTDGGQPATKDGTLTIGPPQDWTATTVDSVKAFWIRWRITEEIITTTPVMSSYCMVYDHGTTTYKALHDSAANTHFTADFQPLPDDASEAIGDAFFVGADIPFCEVAFNLTQVATWGGDGGKWQYYDGSAWSDLTIVKDQTDAVAQDGLRSLGRDGALSFIPPSDWTAVAVNGRTAYWLKYVLTAAQLTQEPLMADMTPELVQPDEGFKCPVTGRIVGIRLNDGAGTLHTDNDVKFILVNFRSGKHTGYSTDGITPQTFAQDVAVGEWSYDAGTMTRLEVRKGDLLGVLVTQEDTNNEVTNAVLELTVEK